MIPTALDFRRRSVTACRRWSTPLALCLLVGVAAEATAQAGAEADTPPLGPPSVALRVGAAVSSPLFEAAGGSGTRSVTGSPDAGFAAGVSAALPLQPKLDLEAEVGWTGVGLGADDGLASWTAEDLTILHGALLLRWHATPSVYARGGFGMIRYAGGQASGILEDDPQVDALVALGLGAHRPAGRVRLFVELNAQAHAFDFTALRAAGGERGMVWRGLLQAGASLPVGGGS
ncbi:MAG TPA: hypothetical protein VK837_09105 [Longimicrobiales bacterium]|nr:hypothetical protein [Longimicrobiales bacterium]